MRFKLIFLLLTGMIFSTSIFSQETTLPTKEAEIGIKTSARCGQCKDRIELAMAFEKGIVNSDLNLEDKVLTVKYKPSKTTAENIRKTISDNGYDADEVVANAKAYDKLPPCCKKPDGIAPVEHTN